MPDIVLKDRDCNDVTHEGVVGVKMLTADGNIQKFLPGEVQEKTVELDFSAGDMEVIPDEGRLLTKVGIPKPVDLVPGKIAEGEYIAGVGPGTHKGGDSGYDFDTSDENLKFFAYYIDAENKQVVIKSVLYDKLYSANGSYDVVVPNKIGGYSVALEV